MGHLTRKTGEEARERSMEGREAWKGERRAEGGCCLGRSPVLPDPQCDRGSPRAQTELQSHPLTLMQKILPFKPFYSQSLPTGPPTWRAVSVSSSLFEKQSLSGTKVFKILTFWHRLWHEGTFSCASSSGEALRIARAPCTGSEES